MPSKKESYFWTSYSDLMTSLFFIMLVLFVLSLVIVKKKTSETITDLEGEIAQLERVTQIDKQFEPLKESGTFIYNEESRKYYAKDLIGEEIFKPDSVDIKKEFVDKTLKVGKAVESMLKQLSEQNGDFKYLLVIEGNMANTYDKKYDKDGSSYYVKSYERALAVYQLWRANGIDLRKYNTEVLICGSGMNGNDRDKIEDNNKRFTIQIVPKISTPEYSKK